MKKVLYWIVGIAIVIKFIRPDFKNPKVDNTLTLNTNIEVMSVLKNSCYDCHSNETKKPWYHNVAPLSWMMSGHIKSGRQALNFSKWQSIDTQIKLKQLKRAKQLIKNEMMPKGEYLLMHENAGLDEEKKMILEEFFDAQIKKLSHT